MNVGRVEQNINVKPNDQNIDPEQALNGLLKDRYDELSQKREDFGVRVQSQPNNQSQQKIEPFVSHYPPGSQEELKEYYAWLRQIYPDIKPYVPHHPDNPQQEFEDYQVWHRNRPDNPLNRPGNQPLKQVIEKFVYGNKDMPNFGHDFEGAANYMEKNMLPTLKNEIAKSTLPKVWKEHFLQTAQQGLNFIKNGDLSTARQLFEKMLWGPSVVPPSSSGVSFTEW